ncbi:MAG: antibiotic biosynthesis monooxygenase [Acidobacteriia bacterium]|nr:antibiotic biosynthesis monooxygenase [Terriglobia bacterium]
MFTRLVEVTTKLGKTKEVAEIIQEKVLPILRKQPGFIDEIVLVSTAEANLIYAMSFWKNPEDAELYRREQYPKVEELLRPLLETNPKILTFDVDTFTTHKIALGKVA